MFSLQDKVALITGAGRGIGRATALLFAAQGARIGICDRDAEGVSATVAEIRAAGGHAIPLVGDITDRAAVDGMVAQVSETWHRLDILINNAGITRDATLVKMTEAQWDQVIDINLKAVFQCTQAVASKLIEQGSGRIINISSIVGVFGNFGQTNYAAAKAGVIGMTKTWARELGRKGITVNAIAPGFIRTELTAAMPEKVLEGMQAKVPNGRLGDPAEIANACLFLAADESAYINGHVLAVDGGMTL